MPMFSQEELNLIFIYNEGSRLQLIDNLREMLTWLAEDEIDLKDLTMSVIARLEVMQDEAFDELCANMEPALYRDMAGDDDMDSLLV